MKQGSDGVTILEIAAIHEQLAAMTVLLEELKKSLQEVWDKLDM